MHARPARVLAAACAVALLALCVRAAGPGSDEPRTPERPVPIVLRLTNTAAPPVRGEVRRWSLDAVWIDVPAVGELRYAWTEVEPSQQFDVVRRLLDRDDAAGRVELGARLLRRGEEALARRAFTDAVRLDQTRAADVDRASAAAAAGQDPLAALHREIEVDPAALAADPRSNAPMAEEPPPRERAELDTIGVDFSLKEWPAMTEQEHVAATEYLRTFGASSLESLKISTRFYETEHFLLFAGLPESEALRCAAQLDQMYDVLMHTLEIPEGTRMFYGKCLIFLFPDKVRFRIFEFEVMRANATNAAGIFHPRGQYCIVSSYRLGDEASFNSTLVHETVHAFMHRYRSPARLPTWANEGLADYIAGHLVEKSTEPAWHWQLARGFVMGDGAVFDVMGQEYGSGWGARESYPVSHMLVRFMLKHRPREFKQWIDDIKGGKGWVEAMHDRFGVAPSALAEGFAKDIRSETKYFRLGH